nr:DNA polymerase IV [Gammaproteobacteria bacterium]
MQKIIHVDMDAFFASIEQRDNPEFRNNPIAVGGQPDRRGVVATASYEARQFGIHSAMPMASAIRLCPNLIIVKPRINYYREIAMTIREIFARYTFIIEPISIDEAYLDVTSNTDFQGSATLLAQDIIDTIAQQTSLTASAGVSYCKFLAKYASNINKPNGIFTITPQQAQSIIDKLPVESFHGIGPATQKKLNLIGIHNGMGLKNIELNVLRKQLGKNADFYHQLAHGIDNREVRTNRIRKSIGSETTFNKDICTQDEMMHELILLIDDAWKNLHKHQILAKTITLKIKYHDF